MGDHKKNQITKRILNQKKASSDVGSGEVRDRKLQGREQDERSNEKTVHLLLLLQKVTKYTRKKKKPLDERTRRLLNAEGGKVHPEIKETQKRFPPKREKNAFEMVVQTTVAHK